MSNEETDAIARGIMREIEKERKAFFETSWVLDDGTCDLYHNEKLVANFPCQESAKSYFADEFYG